MFCYHIGKPGIGGMRLIRRPRPNIILSELLLFNRDVCLIVLLIPRPVMIY